MSIRRHSGCFCRWGECRRIFPDELLHTQWWTQRTRRASKPNGAGVGVLCGCREYRWLGGNAPEDHGGGLLNGFQALAQETGVSVPKLDVVLG
jgi:hypothetical protein